MVTITNGTIDWELSCERYALIGGAPPSGWTVKANTCANYARQLNAPFASFGVGGGDGTVRSVALAADEDVFEVSGSPVTDIGTLILALKEQGAGLVFSGPVTGADAVPTFRAIDFADLPASVIALFGSATLGDVLYFDGANWIAEAADGDVSGPYNNLQIKPNAVGTTEIANEAVTLAKIASTGAYINAGIKWNGTAWVIAPVGTVTSVALTMPAIFTVSNSPVTGGGTLAVALNSQTQKTFLAGPTSGANAVPTFRAFLLSDVAQSGATSGQIASWNGTAWVPVTPSTGGITGTLTAPRIPVASGAGALVDYDELRWDNTTKGIRAGAGAGAVVGTFTAYPLNGNGFYAFASVSGAVYGTLENFWNSSGAGSAYWIIKVGGASAGDPFIMFVIPSGTTWSAGVDNSDNDIFKIGPYQNPGNGALGLQILPTGEVGISGAPNTALAMLFALSKPLGIPSGTDATRALSNTYGSIQYNTTNSRVEVIGASKGYYQMIASYVSITLTVGTAAGTGATAAPENATETHGGIRLDTGTSPTAGTLFTVNFNTMVSPTIVLFAKSASAAQQAANIYVATTSPTQITIACISALPASTIFRWSFRLDG